MKTIKELEAKDTYQEIFCFRKDSPVGYDRYFKDGQLQAYSDIKKVIDGFMCNKCANELRKRING